MVMASGSGGLRIRKEQARSWECALPRPGRWVPRWRTAKRLYLGETTGIRGSLVKRLHAVPAHVVGWPTVAAAAALAVMAAGCSAGATARSATEARAAAPATLTIAPASGGHHVRPG